MKMKKFVPQDSNEIFKYIFMLFATLAMIFVIITLYAGSLILFVVTLVLTMLFISLLKCMKNFGLYIENDKLIFKRFFKKHLRIDDVAGLLIIKSQLQTRYWTSYIKNCHGDYEYSIVYLKEVKPEFANYDRGNLNFMFTYKESAHFYTVYDEEIIEFFKGKVPIITCV